MPEVARIFFRVSNLRMQYLRQCAILYDEALQPHVFERSPLLPPVNESLDSECAV